MSYPRVIFQGMSAKLMIPLIWLLASLTIIYIQYQEEKNKYIPKYVASGASDVTPLPSVVLALLKKEAISGENNSKIPKSSQIILASTKIENGKTYLLR